MVEPSTSLFVWVVVGMLASVNLFSKSRVFQPVVVFEYDMDSIKRGSLPCFIDAIRDQFVISDLGTSLWNILNGAFPDVPRLDVLVYRL